MTSRTNLSDIEIGRVRRILIGAGIPERELAWMVESCPSVDIAMEYYGRSQSAAVLNEER